MSEILISEVTNEKKEDTPIIANPNNNVKKEPEEKVLLEIDKTEGFVDAASDKTDNLESLAVAKTTVDIKSNKSDISAVL